MDKFITNEPKDNVYTLRLNLTSSRTEIKGTPLHTQKHITTTIDNITKVNSYMIFKEMSSKKVKHLHVYLTTSLSIRRIQQILTKKLPKNKGCDKQTHECFSKGVLIDDSLWKASCYIAKDGDLIASKGFSSNVIEEFYRIGSTLKKLAKDRTAVFKQIISIYELDNQSHYRQIVQSVYDYYDTYRARKYPNQSIISNLITQIKNNLNNKYFQSWKELEIDGWCNATQFNTNAYAYDKHI